MPWPNLGKFNEQLKQMGSLGWASRAWGHRQGMRSPVLSETQGTTITTNQIPNTAYICLGAGQGRWEQTRSPLVGGNLAAQWECQGTGPPFLHSLQAWVVGCQAGLENGLGVNVGVHRLLPSPFSQQPVHPNQPTPNQPPVPVQMSTSLIKGVGNGRQALHCSLGIKRTVGGVG